MSPALICSFKEDTIERYPSLPWLETRGGEDVVVGDHDDDEDVGEVKTGEAVAEEVEEGEEEGTGMTVLLSSFSTAVALEAPAMVDDVVYVGRLLDGRVISPL